MSKAGKIFFIIFAAILLTIAVGSIVFAARYLKENVWLGIGIYLGGQFLAGLPLTIISVIGAKSLKKEADKAAAQQKPDFFSEWHSLFEEMKQKAIEEVSKESDAQDESDPVFANLSDNWFDYPPADTNEYHFEVGYGKGDSLNDSRIIAKANANVALVQYIRNSVDAIVVTYVNDSADEDANNPEFMQKIQAYETDSKQKAKLFIDDNKYKYREMEDGGVYVLAALPIDSLSKNLTAGIPEGLDLQKAIDKYFN